MNRFTFFTISLMFMACAASSCVKSQRVADAASEVRLQSNAGHIIECSQLKRNSDAYVQTVRTDAGLLTMSWRAAEPTDAVMLECEFKPLNDADSLDVEFCFYSLVPETVLERYCVPFSLPYLRDSDINLIPERYISNAETCNNTFSLITAEHTYSVSILPTPAGMNTLFDTSAAEDYEVALLPDEGFIRVKGIFGRNLKAGQPVRRRFLMSSATNTPGCFESGYHVGEYMNLVHYPCDMELDRIYECSMDYLLHNPYAFGEKSADRASNYYGAVHSQTGAAFGNGNAFYAMYGNSFSLAALNQYLKVYPDDEAARTRLAAVESFLLDSDVRTSEGAYWSMLDLKNDAGYVDQAYRKWLETHATAWITYFILEALETGGLQKYRSAAEESLRWLVSVQREDGSMPKYFENGEPSSESLGDIAWAVLSLLKAWEMGMGDEFKEAALKALAWMEDSVVGTRQYRGSFEDVGGINDSYCPSVTARAFISAYRCIGESSYLDCARKALSVSLSWVTTGFTNTHHITYDESLRITPSYAQIESLNCYYPCSYTLPMMYLACIELGAVIEDDSRERDFWFGIADNFAGISDFMKNYPGAKCGYGMEWLPAPFLIFSEWGNMQLCWTITKSHQYKPLLNL